MGEKLVYPNFRWLVLLVGILASITFGMNLIFIAPILGEVAKDLGIETGTAANLFTGYVLSGTIVLLLGGVVCDKFGIVTALIAGMLCASVPAVLMPWIGHSYPIVFLLRLIQGTATGFVVTTTGPILALWFPPEERGVGGGLLTGAMSIGFALGVVISPAIYSVVGSWQQTSAILSVAGWITIISALLIMGKRPPAAAPEGMEDQMAVDARGDEVSYKKILVSPALWIAALVVFFGNWALQPLMNLVPAYMATAAPMGLGFGPMISGKLSLAVTVVGIFSTFAGGLFYDKVARGNARLPIVIGFVLTGIFGYALLVPFVYEEMGLLIVCLMLAGWGAMFIFPATSAYVISNFPSRVVGQMIGLSFGIGGFGGVIGLYAAGLSVAKFGNFEFAIMSISLAAAGGVIAGCFTGQREASSGS
jgi:MFS family permease